jgi:hypothetical protein
VPANLTIAEFTGNHLTLDLGGGRYAVYLHMAPHSVTVHVGDQVRTGDKREHYQSTFAFSDQRPACPYWTRRLCLLCSIAWCWRAARRRAYALLVDNADCSRVRRGEALLKTVSAHFGLLVSADT